MGSDDKNRSAQDGEPTYVLFFNRGEVDDLPAVPSGSTAAASPAPTLEHDGISGGTIHLVFTLNSEEAQTYRIIRRIESELVWKVRTHERPG